MKIAAPTARDKIIFVSLIALNFVLNAGSFVWFAFKYHFKLNDFIITFNRGEISTTEFLHNHVLKGAIAIVAQFFHNGVFQNVDSGTAFLDLVPTVFYILVLILFITTVVWSMFYFTKSLVEYKHSSDKVTIVYVFLYGIVTFCLLKNILDGGFFNYETLPAFLFLVGVLFYGNKKAYSLIYFVGILYLTCLCVFEYTGFFNPQGRFFWYLYELVSIALLMGGLFYYVHKRKCDRFCVLIITLTVIALSVLLSNESALVTYRSLVLPESGALVGMYSQPTDSIFTHVASIRDFNFYSVQSQERKTVGNIIDTYGLLDNFYPVDIPWVNCVPTGRPISYTFFLSTKDTFTITSTSSFVTLSNVFIAKNGEWNIYKVSASISQCYPEPLTIMNEFFKSQGLTTFFMYGLIVQTDDRDFH